MGKRNNLIVPPDLVSRPGYAEKKERKTRVYKDLLERNRVLGRKLRMTVEQNNARIKKLENRISELEAQLRDREAVKVEWTPDAAMAWAKARLAKIEAIAIENGWNLED